MRKNWSSPRCTGGKSLVITLDAEVGLAERLTVDEDPALATVDGLAGQTDDALDERVVTRLADADCGQDLVQHAERERGVVLGGGQGRVEHDHVAALRGLQAVRELGDDYPVPTSSFGSIEADGM